MPGGDHCALWGCDNDWRFLPHVGMMKFFSRHNVFYGTALLNHNIKIQGYTEY